MQGWNPLQQPLGMDTHTHMPTKTHMHTGKIISTVLKILVERCGTMEKIVLKQRWRFSGAFPADLLIFLFLHVYFKLY